MYRLSVRTKSYLLLTIMSSNLTVIATGVIAFYSFLHVLLQYTQHAKKPPAIETSLPFVGTAIQFSGKKNRFYIELR